MLLTCAVGEDFWESLGLQGDPTSPSSRRSVLGVHWKDWCWRCNSNTLATWCVELTLWKRPWCWERLKAGGEGDDRGWDGWMASLTQWTWVWVNSRSWWWTGRPGMLQSLGLQRVGPDWATELNWTDAEAPILWPPAVKSWLIGKDPDAGKDWRQKEKRMREDEMVGWHHWLNEHEFKQTLGDTDGQRSLECCSSWGCKKSDTT